MEFPIRKSVAAESVGMAIDCAALDFVIIGDPCNRVPVDDALLDGFALGMRADGATAFGQRQSFGHVSID